MANEIYGGCAALNEREEYDGRINGLKKFFESGKSWWENNRFNTVPVIIFSVMDGLVLKSVFEKCLLQGSFMQLIMTFGIALVLNVLPLIIAKFVHAALYKTKKWAVMCLTIFITGFVLMYGATVYLRFAYKDIYEESDNKGGIVNTVTDASENSAGSGDAGDDDKEKKSTAVCVLLSISPLITSLIAFGIAFFADDEIKKKYEQLRITKVGIEEKIIETASAIKQMELLVNGFVDRALKQDEEAMFAAIGEILAMEKVLKTNARFILAKHLNNPSATSKISQEVRTDNGEVYTLKSDDSEAEDADDSEAEDTIVTNSEFRDKVMGLLQSV